MNGVYNQSKELKSVIENYNWTLYDTTTAQNDNRAFTWEELSQSKPAEHYETGHNYLFVPIPKEGQTLRQAYSINC